METGPMALMSRMPWKEARVGRKTAGMAVQRIRADTEPQVRQGLQE